MSEEQQPTKMGGARGLVSEWDLAQLAASPSETTEVREAARATLEAFAFLAGQCPMMASELCTPSQSCVVDQPK
jgi:hypothetical protein